MGEQLGVRVFEEVRCSSSDAPGFPGWKGCLGAESSVAGARRRMIFPHLRCKSMARPALVLLTLAVSLLLLFHHSSAPGGGKKRKI